MSLALRARRRRNSADMIRTPSLPGLQRWALAALLLSATVATAQTRELRETVVAVHGRVVQIAQAGPISGPTVVFENGLGETLDSWRRVAPLLWDQVQLLAYNRPGYGRSAPLPATTGAAPAAASGGAVCAQLQQLLEATGAQPPYVLVGHSLGGLYVQACARRLPQQIAGLVLVDPVVRGQEALLRQHDHLGAALLGALQGTLSHAASRELRASAELQAEVAALPVFDRGPVLTLMASHDRSTESLAYKDARRAAMREQTLQYPQGEVIVIDAGHMLTDERPRAIAEAVLRVLHRDAPTPQAALAEPYSMQQPVLWRLR